MTTIPSAQLPDLLAFSRIWEKLDGDDALTARGMEWILLTNPDPTGRALIVGGDNPLTPHLAARLFGEVTVWKLDKGQADDHLAFLHAVGETQNVEYVPAIQVSDKLASIEPQFSLIAFDDSIHACLPDLPTLLHAAGKALLPNGQCCVVSGNKYGPNRLRSMFKNPIRYPTAWRVRRAAKMAGFSESVSYYPYPSHEDPREILGWPDGLSQLRRHVATRILCRLGLAEATFDSFILLASRTESRSALLDFAGDTVSESAHDEPAITSCLVRPNGTMVVLFRRTGNRYVLRIPLNTAAHDRLRHATSVTEAVCEGRDWLKSVIPSQHANTVKLGLPYFVESQCRGATALSLLGNRQLQAKVQLAAMRFLCDLSGQVERTTISKQVFDEIIRDHVEPIVRHFPNFADQLLQVVDDLQELMVGRAISFTQTHGDFYVSNVFCDTSSGEVCGVIDWDASEDAGLPLIDLLHFLQGCGEDRRKMPIGKRIVSAVAGELLSEFELNLMNSYMDELKVDRKLVGPLTVLYWARHVCVHIKYRRGELNPDWVADNVQYPVDRLHQLLSK